MLKWRATAGLAGGMGLTLLGTAAMAAGPASFTVVERATTDAVTDLGASGDSAGDVLTFANEVFDAADAEKVGSDSGFCVRTIAGKAWECFWTLSLANGQLTVAGPFLDAGDSTLTITGGTGHYAGAKGEMKLHARDAKGSAYDFTYVLAE